MKKLITLIVILGIALVGCVENESQPNTTDIYPAQAGNINISSNQTGSYKTVRIDGCQYILMAGFREGSLTHKGNCDNPIHKKDWCNAIPNGTSHVLQGDFGDRIKPD